MDAWRPPRGDWIHNDYGDTAIDNIHDGFQKPNPPDSFNGITRSAPDSQSNRYALVAPCPDGWPGTDYPAGRQPTRFQSEKQYGDSKQYHTSPVDTSGYEITPFNHHLEPRQSENVQLPEDYMDRIS